MTAAVIPDRVGRPAVGYRMWLVESRTHTSRRYRPPVPNPEFGLLRSFNWPQIDEAWPGRCQLEALCAANKEHPAPNESCHCGIWAFKKLADVEEALFAKLAGKLAETANQYSTRWPHTGGTVWLACGSVQLWGTVIEGSRGYRAQYAYPSELWLLPPAPMTEPRGHAGDPETARDLLRALRNHYRRPASYAAAHTSAGALLASFQLSRFYAWRLTYGGSDPLEHKLGTAGKRSSRPPTIRELLQLWLDQRTRRHGADTTRRDRAVIARHLQPAFGDLLPEAIDRSTLDGYLAAKAALSSSTIDRHLRILRAALDHAAQHGLARTPITRSSSPSSRLASVTNALPRPLDS